MTNQLLTPNGKQKLEEELKKLQQKRVQVALKIKDAKELGDLSENAEYHAAKEEQGFMEARILEIEFLLKSATLVKPSSSKFKVVLGSKIKVKSAGQIFEYEIVGLNEADPASGKISASSPLGAAFMGAKAGDEVEVDVPAGKMKFKIVEIG
jgi:transcription elongation factor GreA